jgi:hypothetical protein
MDLVAMPPYNDHHYILQDVDLVSKFGYVWLIKQRTAKKLERLYSAFFQAVRCPKYYSWAMGATYRLHLFSFCCALWLFF